MSLFDTNDDARGPERGGDTAARPGPGGNEPRMVSLVRLCALIARAATEIGRVAVEGEIHRPQTGRSGRQWFTLRDRASQIGVSVPAARRGRFRVVAGERACVTGRLEWVNDWGQLHLLADEVVPVGEGAIAAMIAEARRRLGADGLLARARRAVPRVPTAIGVVCGHEAAVRADIESVVVARFPGYPVVFRVATVSGPGAVDDIIAAMEELEARPEVEVIILARGGGDATALLPFSDEALCRAVCSCRIPVVSAIGHEGDRPLVDEVADLRFGTPSLAAGAVVPDRAALQAALDGGLAAVAAAARGRLGTASAVLAGIDRHGSAITGLDRAADRLARAVSQRDTMRPQRELERARAGLARVGWQGVPAARLDAARRSLGAARAQAEALSPARVIDRGYAVVRRRDDRSVVRRPSQVVAGDALELTVADGRIAAITGDPEPPSGTVTPL